MWHTDLKQQDVPAPKAVPRGTLRTRVGEISLMWSKARAPLSASVTRAP